uniref:T. congolense-specific, cell surface-expressed gene family n=1 Tax=Trypanosoma congolense (strain IL3000) TaxID=1068625 RepID=G0USG3_TRYCI|nr:hypothetical protein, unlikely [Trypanosoma congolense IL3000]
MCAWVFVMDLYLFLQRLSAKLDRTLDTLPGAHLRCGVQMLGVFFFLLVLLSFVFSSFFLSFYNSSLFNERYHPRRQTTVQLMGMPSRAGVVPTSLPSIPKLHNAYVSSACLNPSPPLTFDLI